MRADRKAWLGLAVILVVGGVLYLPCVRTPYLLDDYMHAAMVEGRLGMQRGVFDLYDFVNDHDRANLTRRGLLPWWADEHLKIRFFRPLPSALRFFELRAFPDRALLMHVHSLAWWVLAVLLAAWLFRRIVSPRAALVATAIFALGPWNVLPLSWLANREILMTLVAGIVALELVRRRTLPASIGATVALVLAFGCGEYAFCFGGYVLALACIGPARALWRRIVELLPFVLPALGYLAIRVLYGYGTAGSSFYADPLRQPLNLIAVAPSRLAMLLAEGWLTLGTDPWGPGAPRWAVTLAIVATFVLVALALRRLHAELDVHERRTIAWLVPGSLLALVPVLAAVPAPRLLGVSALGMAAAVGVFLERAWFPRDESVRRTPELVGLVATGLAFAQLVHGPIASVVSARELELASRASDDSLKKLSHELDDAAPHVVRGGGSAFFGPFSPWLRGHEVDSWCVLAQTPHVLVVTKTDHELELSASELAPLYPSGAANLYRDAAKPQRVGDVIVQNGMRVEILAIGPLGPTRARFTFAEPIDGEDDFWLDEKLVGLTAIELPGVGFGAPFDPL